MSRKLTKGLPARIILETTIFQEGEIFKHSFDEMGRIVEMNENYYFRFTEPGEKEVTTLIKLSADGTVQITRHADEKTILEFDESQHTYTQYKTPTGILSLRVETNQMRISYSQSPFAGEVEIDYKLYMEENQLGSYQVRLRFTI